MPGIVLTPTPNDTKEPVDYLLGKAPRSNKCSFENLDGNRRARDQASLDSK